MAQKMLLEVGIAAPSVIVQKLFPLPVLLTAILNFGSLPSLANVGQRRPTSGSILCVKSKSHVVENMGTTFEIASQSRTVQMLFPVPVLVAAILNRQSPTSGDIDVVIFRSAMVENVGVAFAIMSVCCWKLKLHRPAENLRFFQRCARPWFSRSLQVLERAAFTRKPRNIRNRTLKEQVAP